MAEYLKKEDVIRELKSWHMNSIDTRPLTKVLDDIKGIQIEEPEKKDSNFDAWVRDRFGKKD